MRAGVDRDVIDADGREDYLGTYAFRRHDKNGVLAILSRHATSGTTLALAQLTQ